MNIPNWAKWALAAVGFAGATAVVTDHVSEHAASIIHLSGTPEQAEAAIRAKFTNPEIQDSALDSLYRRLEHIAGDNGRVLSLSGDFYLDARHGHSLFPEGFDHSQRAQVERTKGDGTVEIVDVDLTEVPQDVTDNSRQDGAQ